MFALLCALFLLATATVIAPPESADAFPANSPWTSTEHRYRVPIDVTSTTGGTDVLAVASVNFSTAFSDAGAPGATFDPSTLLVHEVDATGATIDAQVAFQFDPSVGYDAVASASGELVIAMAGTTTPAVQRHFAAYFEQAGVATTPASVAPVLTVNATTDEGVSATQITTPTATWFYDMAGGGFSSVIDTAGNDWVSYNAAAGSAGEFRGIPNLVFPEGHFHPGATSSTTTIDSSGPLRASLTSATADGWQIRWEVFASHARATVLAAPTNYWFLYEGTPGGALDAGDLVITSDGTTINALDGTFGADLVGDEWVAFADPAVGKSLFLANHTDDTAFDTYSDLDDAMTVFGFGRQVLGRELVGSNRSFSVGFVDAVDSIFIAPTAQQSLNPPTAVVGLGETSNTSPVDAEFISDDFNSAALGSQWTFIDPVGDASVSVQGVGTGQATVALSVPQGTNHDAWSTNNSARITQPVSNTDMSLEAGFDSTPNAAFQINGLLVEDAASNYVRFDVYHDGANLRAFGADITNGIPTPHINVPVPADTRFLRLERTGDTWTGSYSSDQVNWTIAGTFAAVITASSAGVFAGNAGANPAFTAVVDYVFDTNSPVDPEDGVVVPTYPVDVTVIGAGSVTKSPDQAVYADGSIVTLTAVPDAGQVFAGWTGAVTSSDDVVDVTISGGAAVLTATFEVAPVGFPIDVSVVGAGAVSKTPEQASYVDGSIVTLVAVPDAGQNFVGWTGDVTSTDTSIDVTIAGQAIAVTATFEAEPVGYPVDVVIEGNGSVSKSPDQALYTDGSVVTLTAVPGPGETFVGWNGDVGGGGGPASATLFDQVNYDPSFYFETFDAGTYDAAALGQLNNDIEAIQVPADTQVTLCANSDGTGFCESYTSNVPVLRSELKDKVSYVVIQSTSVGSADPVLEVTVNGAPVTATATFTNEVPTYSLNIDVSGDGSVTRTPDQSNYIDGATVQLTATPAAGESFLGWSGDVTSISPVIDVTIVGSDIAVTASFTDTPPVGSGFTSDDFNAPVLGGQWSFVDPVGDSSFALAGAGSGQATIALSVPAGTAHDAFNTNNSARLMQPIGAGDVQLEVAFESAPSQRYQLQGLLFEQDADTWARFDVYHDGVNLRAFGALTTASSTQVQFNVAVPANASFLRVDRVADTWTSSYSTDGETWVEAGSFDFALASTQAGVFAGNAGPNPAWTAVVDYIFDNATPVEPEDDVVTVPTYAVAASVVGNGVVSKAPDQSAYLDGSVVTLTATPAAGELFVGWSGDVTSTDATISVAVAGADIAVTATFTETIATHAVDASVVGNGVVSKAPDQSAYLDGSVVTLTATPAAGELFVGWSGDVTSTDATISVTVAGADIAVTATFTDTPVGSNSFISDDFNAPVLESQWTFVDPVGDSSFVLDGSGTGQATVSISVPSGTRHDAWRTNNAARLMQSIDNTDFELEAAFESTVAVRHQLQGMLVEQDAGNWIRLDVYSDGSSQRVFGAVTTNGQSQAQFNVAVAGDVSHLRLTRTGDQWAGAYSSDGVSFTPVGSFSAPLTATTAGVFAGNAGANPAFTAVVDYMFETATPVVPEDDAVTIPTYSINTTIVGNGSVAATPDQPTYLDGAQVQLIANPNSGETFVGWSGDVASTDPIITVTIAGANADVTATFSEDSVGSNTFVSDDFNAAALGSQWILVDPVGDSSVQVSGVDTGQATAALSVPAGTRHDAWRTNNAARIMQPIDDDDFEIEAGFLSEPASRFQLQGLLVEEDAGNWVRFDTYHDGSNLRIFGAVTFNGSSQAQFNSVVPTGTRYLRLNRAGDAWTASYSANGSAWTTAGSFTFALSPTTAGVFAGNAGANPAFTAVVDYVFDTSAPIVPEDGVVGNPGYPVDVVIAGNGAVAKSPDQALYLDGSVVTLTAVPGPGETFVGWNGSVGGGGGPASATLFDQVNYDPSFYFETFAAGTYNAAALGQLNNDIESIQVAADTRVTLCANSDGSGFCESYTSNVSVLRSELKDKVSYVVIESTVVGSADPVLEVTVNGSPVTVTATFTTNQAGFPVDVMVVGDGSVDKSPNQGTYIDGTTVQLTATPDTGETFIGWTGDVTSTSAVIEVTVNGAAVTVTATFTDTPSPSGIDVWFGSNQTFGDDGVPQRWINVLGNASDPLGIASLGFRLNGGEFRPLNLGSDLRRIYAVGDFNVEIDTAELQVGANQVLIILQNGIGDVSTETVTVNWTPTAVSSAAYVVDWSSASAVTDGAQIVDGNWELRDGMLRTVEGGYDRSVAIGELTWQDYTVEVPFIVHAQTPGAGTPQSGEPLVGMALRWQGHSEIAGAQPNWGFFPTGAFAYYRLNASGNRVEVLGNDNTPNDRAGFNVALGVPYIIKAEAETVATGTEYRVKIWEQGQPEPSTWAGEILETNGPDTGSLLLLAHHFDVSFGTIVVTSGDGPLPNQPPSVVAGADATVTLPASASLAGSVTDDGLPASGNLTSQWSKVSGPGLVTFGDATSPTTTAAFTAAGTYVLRLTADDGQLSASDEVQFTVSPAPGGGDFADDFNPAGYGGNDGSLSFLGPWTELNDDASSSSGQIYIWNTDAACSPAPCVRVQAVDGNEGIERSMDLSAVGQATLTFDYYIYGGTNGVNLVLDDGADEVVVEQLTVAAAGTNSSRTVNIGDYVNLTSNVTVRFVADAATGNRTYPDNVTVTTSGTPTNQAPEISAGSDQDVQLPAVASLAGSASDDGLPANPGEVSVQWSMESGPGTVSFADENAAVTTASFSTAGSYLLRLTAEDGQLNAFDDIEVTVSAAALTGTFIDTFATSGYGGNSGSLSFSGPWSEINDNGSSSDGGVRIWPNQAPCNPAPCVRVRAVTGNEGIERSLDLAGANQAVLTFDYSVYGGTNGANLVLSDGVNTVTVQQLFVSGSGADASVSINIEDYVDLTSNVTIRFASPGPTGNRTYPDNVTVTAS